MRQAVEKGSWRKVVGEQVKQARERMGATRGDLAFRLRLLYRETEMLNEGDAPSADVLGNLERGEFRFLPYDVAWALTMVPDLGLTLDDFSPDPSATATVQMGRKRKSAGQRVDVRARGRAQARRRSVPIAA